MGGGNIPPPPPPIDYSPIMMANISADLNKFTMQVGSQILQTQMMTSMMNMEGTRNLMAQQNQLDAKLEIASMNYEARMKEAQYGHQERMAELANDHVETLANSGAIKLDSSQYNYPYQWGSA